MSGSGSAAVTSNVAALPIAAAGGDIGWLTPAQLGSPLGTAVEKMKPGEMSYPIRTPGGYYILYVVDRRTPGATSTDDTRLTLTQVSFIYPTTASAAEHQRVLNDARISLEQISRGVIRRERRGT